MINVRSFLLAEFVRPELHNKATIIGFLGILPFIDISMTTPSIPLTLGMLVFCEGEPGTYRLQVTIDSPDGSNVFNGDGSISIGKNRYAGVVFNVVGLTLKLTGKYDVKVRSEGNQIYRETFNVASD